MTFGRSGGWLMPLWIAGLVALLLTVLAWPISALVRRHYKATYALSGRDATAHRRMRWIALLEILLIVAIGTTFGMMFNSLKYMGPGIEKWVAVLRFVTLVVLIVGAVVALWNAAVVLGSGQRRWPAKVWSIVLAVSCVITLWVGLVFKLAGFGGNF